MILGNVTRDPVQLLGPADPIKAAARHVQYKINEAEQRLAHADCVGARTAITDAFAKYVLLLRLRSAAGVSRRTDKSVQPLLFDISRVRRRLAQTCMR